jgi:YEATS domain-containing protein 4
LNEDLSKWIEKVVFTLHETFKDRIRVIKKPPYEITEYGWGEFPIPIKIFFKGKNPPKPI